MTLPGEGPWLTWPQARKAAPVLKAAWAASGVSYAALGRRLGWEVTKVRNALNAASRIRTADALALADALGVDPGALGLADGEKK